MRRLRWRDARYDVDFTRDSNGIAVTVANHTRPRPLVVKLAPAPGAEPEGGVRELRFAGGAVPETRRLRVRPGIEITAVQEPLTRGDTSRRLRIIATRFDGTRYWRASRVAAASVIGRVCWCRSIAAVKGGGLAGRDGAWTNVALDFPAGDHE